MHEIEQGQVDEIRKAIHSNYALGNEVFCQQIAVVFGRRVSPGKSGRPKSAKKMDSDNKSR